MERQWKLGEDMHPSDCILDPITFEQIIIALHCNEKVIDEHTVLKVVREAMDSRVQDLHYLVTNNMQEIIAEAKKGRGII